MRLLVFQHSSGEPPAAFSNHAKVAGDTLDIIQLFAGDAIPSLERYDALLVMGGPMDVWEEDANPWLVSEKTAIREWVLSGKPYLGICLGHQLLADAIGGKCTRMDTPEIAVSEVSLSLADDDLLLKGLPQSFRAVHWHGVEVTVPPLDAQILGFSACCANQIMRVGKCAWGLQFHPEVMSGTLTKWMEDPANISCASDWLGSEQAAWDFVQASEEEAHGFLERSQTIYNNFRLVW